MGVKCEMRRVMRDMQVSASAFESTGFVLWANSEVSAIFEVAVAWSVVDMSVPQRAIASVSVGVGGLIFDIGISGLDFEWASTDFTALCGSTVAVVSETSKSVVVTKW